MTDIETVSIRAEQPGDEVAIGQLVACAFRDVAHSDQRESVIVDALRDAGALTLSLVAIDRGTIVGHAAFSPVAIDRKDRGWFGLGPVSVMPSRQGEGIGSALVRHGLKLLRRRGAAGCVLLGEPDYYRRFGFERDDRLWYESAPADYFLRLRLAAECSPRGRVTYHPAFGG